MLTKAASNLPSEICKRLSEFSDGCEEEPKGKIFGFSRHKILMITLTGSVWLVDF